MRVRVGVWVLLLAATGCGVLAAGTSPRAATSTLTSDSEQGDPQKRTLQAPAATPPGETAPAGATAPNTRAPAGKAPAAVDAAPSEIGEPAETEASLKAATPVEAPAPFLPPQPDPFEGQEQVKYSEFVDELRKVADALSAAPAVQAAHQQLLATTGLSEEELPLISFSRVRLAFESGRDSGLWGLWGVVTDQMPWSDKIWSQWQGQDFGSRLQSSAAGSACSANGGEQCLPQMSQPQLSSQATAKAECDELGALFAILARDMGVVGFVGLHWPVWNHVVPVWQVERKSGGFVRIVVPSTQTFLPKEATIGTDGLATNRVVFPYRRRDRKPYSRIDADLARYLLQQSRTYGALSTEALIQRRLRQRRLFYHPNSAANGS